MNRSLLKGNNIVVLFLVALLMANANTIVAQTQLPATKHVNEKKPKKTTKHRRTKHKKHHIITHQSANDKQLEKLKEEKDKQKGIK